MPDEPQPRVSIIVPAFNEALRLPRSVEAMQAHFARWNFPHEILIVVEQSGDGTLELVTAACVRQANFRVIDTGVHRGKGFAVRSGMKQARGEIVFYMDADLSVPLEEIGRFLAHFDAYPGHHVLIGNRQNAASRIERQQSALRQTMGKAFNACLRSLFTMELRDTQCGFKAFRRGAAREIFSRQSLDGFAFDVEVLLLARALGYRIADLPVRWINSSESKVRILRDSARMLGDILRVHRLVSRAMREKPAVSLD